MNFNPSAGQEDLKTLDVGGKKLGLLNGKYVELAKISVDAYFVMPFSYSPGGEGSALREPTIKVG